MTVGSALLEEVVQEVVDSVGSRIRLATPLGIGKPNPLVNAFYRRAERDPLERADPVRFGSRDAARGGLDLGLHGRESIVGTARSTRAVMQSA